MNIRLILVLLCLPFILQASTIEEVQFFRGNLSAAKKLAGQEGKLYFAEFTASWCAPCRVLEETTFKDPQVIQYINQHYIPVKVDIDNFDGIALKQVYNVQTIPTIIIFNSQGQLLEKYDKNLPASKMLSLLKKHNSAQNKVAQGNIGTAPSQNVNTNHQQSTSNSPGNVTSYSKLNKVQSSHSPMQQSPVRISKPDKKPVTPISSSEEINTPNTPVAEGNGLYRFKVHNQVSAGFSVQIGAFGEYGNVLREVARIQDHFEEPIIVHIVNKPDKTLYKVLIGEFSSRQKAMQYQSKLKSQGLEGVIRNMQLMK